jgi:hypothetical protein
VNKLEVPETVGAAAVCGIRRNECLSENATLLGGAGLGRDPSSISEKAPMKNPLPEEAKTNTKNSQKLHKSSFNHQLVSKTQTASSSSSSLAKEVRQLW